MPSLDELLAARHKAVPASAPASTSAPKAPAPLPPYATALQDDLRGMAEEQDYRDVELSAQGLSEVMNAVMHIPYPPDIFIDECVEYASQALENQKRVYIQRVMSGEKQTGKRDMKKAVAVAMKVENLDGLFD